MKKFSLVIIVGLSVLLMGQLAPKQTLRSYGTTIASTALDAASSTVTLNNLERDGAWGLANMYIQITDADNSVTAITMKCYASKNGGTTNYQLQDCAIASGVATCYNLSWVHNPSGTTSPKKWIWRVETNSIEDLICVFTDTGGTSGDYILVKTDVATN